MNVLLFIKRLHVIFTVRNRWECENTVFIGVDVTYKVFLQFQVFNASWTTTANFCCAFDLKKLQVNKLCLLFFISILYHTSDLKRRMVTSFMACPLLLTAPFKSYPSTIKEFLRSSVFPSVTVPDMAFFEILHLK